MAIRNGFVVAVVLQLLMQSMLTGSAAAQPLQKRSAMPFEASLVSASVCGTGNAYDPAGNLTATTLGNGLTESRTYDPAGQLRTLLTGGAAGTLLDLAYTYDAAGNVASRTDATGGSASQAVTERVSESSQHGQANDLSKDAYVSADGRYVTFESQASDLVSGDTNATTDVFVTDRVSDTTSRVSLASDGTQANGSSEAPSISPDGRYVAFRSAASNLVSGDTNAKYDIFLYDRQSAIVSRVSIASDGTQANSSSDTAVVSRDGAFVAFRSFAHTLVTGDSNGATDIFVRDVAAGTTSRVSVASDGTQANADSDGPTISDDGQVVARVGLG